MSAAVCNCGIGTNAECPCCLTFHCPQCFDCCADDVLKTSNNGGAREAVARAIETHTICMCGEGAENLTEQAQHIADYALAALAPIIAAEIRAWADLGFRAVPPLAAAKNPQEVAYARGASTVLSELKRESDVIASRICGGEA
jgi:hypothetical protein